MLKNKKATMQISIIVTVILTFVLVTLALFIFSSRQTVTDVQLSPNVAIDKVYSRAEILNFQLNDMCREIQSEENPAEDFNKILSRYKDKSGIYHPAELSQIESQVDSKHITLDENAKLIVTFDITLSNESVQKKSTDEGLKVIKYVYNFKFEEIMS